MAKDIKTSIVLDGEREFKNACKNINLGLNETKEKLKLTQEEYKCNADSLEALNAKQALFKERMESSAKKVQAAQDALQKFKDAGIDDTDASMVKMRTSLVKMQTEFKQSENAFNDAGKKIEKLQEEMASAAVAGDDLGDGLNEAGEGAANAKDDLNAVGESAEAGGEKFAKFGEKLGNIGWASVKAGAAAAAAAIAATGAAIAKTTKELVGFALGAGETADGLLTQSSITGLSTTELQKYQYALQFIDGNINDLADGLKNQAKNSYDATNGNKELASVYQKLGVSLTDSTGKMRDSKEVYFETMDALSGIEDKTQRDAIAMKLFGESAVKLGPLMDAGIDEFNRYGAEAEAMGIVLGEDNVNRLGKFNDKMNQLKSVGASLKNTLGLIALPFLEKISAGGLDILGKFNKAMQDAGGDSKKMAKAFSELAKDISKMASEMLPELIDMGSELLMALLEGLVDNIDSIASSLGELLGKLMDMIAKNIPQIIQMMVEFIKIIAGAIIENLPTILLGIIEGISALLEPLLNVFMELGTKIWDGIVNAWNSIVSYLGGLWESLKSTAKTAWENILNAITSIFVGDENNPSGLQKTWQTVVDGVIGIWNDIVESAKKIWQSIVNAVVGVFSGDAENAEGIQGTWKKITDGVEGIWNALTTAADTIWKAVIGAIVTVLGGDASKVDGIAGTWKTITDAVEKVWNDLTTAADTIWQSIVDGATKIFAPVNTLIDKLKDAVKWLKEVLGLGDDLESKGAKVHISVNGMQFGGGSVSFDDLLSKEERRSFAKASPSAQPITIIQNIYADSTDYYQQQKQATRQFENTMRYILNG